MHRGAEFIHSVLRHDRSLLNRLPPRPEPAVRWVFQARRGEPASAPRPLSGSRISGSARAASPQGRMGKLESKPGRNGNFFSNQGVSGALHHHARSRSRMRLRKWMPLTEKHLNTSSDHGDFPAFSDSPGARPAAVNGSSGSCGAPHC